MNLNEQEVARATSRPTGVASTYLYKNSAADPAYSFPLPSLAGGSMIIGVWTREKILVVATGGKTVVSDTIDCNLNDLLQVVI